MVYICTPTGSLADVYRMTFKNHALVKVDTFDGLFRFLSEEGPNPYCILDAAVIIVDEVGLLGLDRFEFAFRCWTLAGKRATLIFAGDFAQGTAPSGAPRADFSEYWKGPRHQVREIRLDAHHRMKGQLAILTDRMRVHSLDPRGRRQLVGLRVFGSTPASRRASIQNFYAKYPSGVLMAGKRRTVKALNLEMLEVYAGDRRRKYVPAVDSNNEFDAEMPLFEGARVMITQNSNKRKGLVNGAFGKLLIIKAYCLVLLLDSGNGVPICLPRIPIKGMSPVQLAFPITLAYAVTVSKMQGRNLQAVAIEPDLKVKGHAYTAVSRVADLPRLWWISAPTDLWFLAGHDH